MKITLCKEKQTISIGNFSIDKYTATAFKPWLHKVLLDNDCYASTYPRKAYYKTATEVLQCTPSVLYKHFMKLQYKVYIVPYLEYMNKIGFNKGGVNIAALDKIIKNKELLEQAKKDNLWNLIPFICHFSKSPAELKVIFGKDWRKIANNSLHRNKYLSVIGNTIVEYIDVPTTLIKQRRLTCHSANLLKHLELHYKGKWKDIGKNSSVIDLFVDTERLADNLSKLVNPAWTPRRLKEEHDKMSKEINAKKYSKEVFKSIENVQVKELQHKGVHAVLLDNAFDIADEGTCMNHCVGLYSRAVATGDYLVYSVRDLSKNRLSTVGINIINGEYIFNQHYGKCNLAVSCPEQTALVKELIIKLNKKECK